MDARLTSYGSDLNLDIDNLEGLCAAVDLDETRIDSLVEVTEAGDETDGTC